MTVCKFYQQGNCKFGDRCKFEHPNSSQGRRQQDAPRNPFAPLAQNQGFAGRQRGPQNPFNRQNGQQQQQYDNRNLPYHLDTRTIRDDLTHELPVWPFSCYGPGRDAPRQLIEGESEQSPEEMRTLFYIARLDNNVPAAVQDEQARHTNSQSQVGAILGDVDGACRYIIEGEHQHPNRWDVCEEGTGAPRGRRRHNQPVADFRRERSNPFNLPQQAVAFGGMNSAAPDNPFNKAPPVNPFGAPAVQPAINPFNKTPAAQPTAFGQPSMPVAQNPFGQPVPAKPVNPFGTPASGQPQNPFGQPPQNNGISQPSQPQNPFNEARVASASPFSNSQRPAPQPDFRQAQPQAPARNPFGQARNDLQPPAPAFGAPPPSAGNFGALKPATGFGGSQQSWGQTNGTPTTSSVPNNQSGQLSSGARTSGQAVGYYADTEAVPKDEQYGPEGSERRIALEETYRKVREIGRFEGDVPEQAPLHEWRDFNI